MRLIEATVPDGALQNLKEALSENEFEYFVIDETSPKYAALLHIPIEDDQVEPVLEVLYKSGLSSDDHVVILKAEVDVKVIQDEAMVSQNTEKIVVNIARPPDVTYPRLHGNITRAVKERVGEDVNVDIQVSLLVRGSSATAI